MHGHLAQPLSNDAGTLDQVWLRRHSAPSGLYVNRALRVQKLRTVELLLPTAASANTQRSGAGKKRKAATEVSNTAGT